MKVGERNIEMICKKEEHEKEGRRKEHGKNMQGRGTWKGNVGDRYMERKVGEMNMEMICRRGTWKGYVGERNMERICKREGHVKEGRKDSGKVLE